MSVGPLLVRNPQGVQPCSLATLTYYTWPILDALRMFASGQIIKSNFSICRDCFLPDGELSGKVTQFCGYLNQVFPVKDQPGPLYLLATDSELKRLLMELTGELLESGNLRKIRAARKVGINIGPDNWVFSPSSVVSTDGRLYDADRSPVMWLERPNNTTNILINGPLSCSIKTPLDNGEAFRDLCYEIQCFMPENFLPTLAAMSACVTAASYQQVIASCGCTGVPLLYGVPGSCKSEALKCGLALFGAQKSHLYNSQTTPSFLFQVLTQTTIPIGIEYIRK